MKRTMIVTAMFALVATALFAGESYAKRVKDKIVKEECGVCHMTYQPRFLPSESWLAIMSNLDDHFGGDASLDDEETAIHITDYLVKRAGRKRRHKKGKPPLRISKLRWFVREHRHEVSRRARRRAGTMSNCVACHRGAEKGYYDDD